MALVSKRSFVESILSNTTAKSTGEVHVFEPEFHQDMYLQPAKLAKASKFGAYLMTGDLLAAAIHRGKQPDYVDDPDDPDSLTFVGKLNADGTRTSAKETSNVAAIKSVGVRNGYVDIDSSRSVSAEYYKANQARAGVKRNDVLINSTGDGTIGRVAVYHYDIPAVVDGHITIVRFKDPTVAWYTAAYLLTSQGQHQIYRYINGSSGQVEIYPQDIERLWIPRQSDRDMAETGTALRDACTAFETFRSKLGTTVALATHSS